GGGPGPGLVAAHGGHLASPPEPHPGGERVVERAVAQRLQEGQALDDALAVLGATLVRELVPGQEVRMLLGGPVPARPPRPAGPLVVLEPRLVLATRHLVQLVVARGRRRLGARPPAATHRYGGAEHGEDLTDVGVAIERLQLGPRP